MRPVGQLPEETPALAILAVSALVGGGFFGYQAMRSLQEGGLLSMDEYEKRAMTGFEKASMGAALLVGGFLTYESLKEAADEVGMEPIVLGGVGLTALTGVLWLRDRR